MSKSVTKARTALILKKYNRMIPRFSFIRPARRKAFVTDLDISGRDGP